MNTISEKVGIFIDGSNFYHGASRLLSNHSASSVQVPLKYDYNGLIQLLASGRTVTEKTYYVGLVRRDPKRTDAKVEQMVRNQQRLFALLESAQIHVEQGHLMRYPSNSFHEKGVDVRLAIDLVEGAYENRYDVAILLSSDTDMIPALQRVKKYGKKVEYVGFADRPSFGLQRNADLTKLLTKQEIEKFLPHALFPTQ